MKLHNNLTVFGCKRNIMIQELAKLHDHMCESVIRIVRIWMIFLRNPSGIWQWCWVSPTPEKIINNLVNTNIFYQKVHYRISPKQFWKSKIVLYSSENMFLDLLQIKNINWTYRKTLNFSRGQWNLIKVFHNQAKIPLITNIATIFFLDFFGQSR